MNSTAIITGITGQDGSYLAELLLEKKYKVVGLVRRSSNVNTSRISTILNHPNLSLVQADMADSTSIMNVFLPLRDSSRIEVYNLAAQSHVHSSFSQPEYTADVNGTGVLRILEAIRQLGLVDKTRFYQASTSEMFGKVVETPQSETTPFYPRSPYGVAKLYGFWITKNYRESYGMFACNGILFNHESERRGEEFVTRKITKGIAKVYSDPNFTLEIGNMDAKRDWGHAQEYVYGMWLMLQQDVPDDFVLATGETHTVREFVELAFKSIGHSITWSGNEINEIGTDETGRIVVRMNPKFYRPAEVELLIGNPTKAKTVLGWSPKITFEQLVNRMMVADSKTHTSQGLSS
jgi:GDPmannose 4,6-dehydratase